MAESTRVLLIEEQPVTREGLLLAVRGALPNAAVTAATSAVHADALLADRRFDLILFDFTMPGRGGLAGLLALKKMAGHAAILVICARCDPLTVSVVGTMDVAGIVSKSDPLDVIQAAIGKVANGGTAFPPLDAPGMSKAAFSKAQLRVLAALGTGRLNKQIAEDLGVTEATIKAHLSAVFRKLGVTNRTQALLVARPLIG